MSTSLLACLVVIILQSIGNVGGANILMTGVQMRSHVIEQLALGEELASRGHQVYYAVGSRYPDLKDIEKRGMKVLTFFVPDGVPYFCTDDVNKRTANMIFNMTEAEKIDYQIRTVPDIVSRDCGYMMTDAAFMSSVKTLKFDIAIVEAFIFGSCSLLLPKQLGLKFVTYPATVYPWDIRLPVLPSFYRQPSPWPLSDLASIKNRFSNLYAFLFLRIMLWACMETQLLTNYSNGLSSWDELIRESELIIIDRDHLLDDVMPVTPNIILLPGLTSAPGKPLPLNLEEIMNGNSNGIVLMTFGSMAGLMPDKIAMKFLDAFGMLNQTVLAKLKAPEGAAVPSNVKLFSWLPQNDILAHKNTKLFITHCGSNGQYEAVYHGVPMIGFPLYAEQPSNCQKAMDKDFGRCMNIHQFSAIELHDAIQEVLSNKKYSLAIRRSSAIARSDPMTGREKAAYWVEHVTKFGGKHLRSSAMDMPLHQFLLFDVLGLTCLVALVALSFVWLLLRLIVRKIISNCCSRSNKIKKS